LPKPKKITSETVRADFNELSTVVAYARAAHFLGLWKSERQLIERVFPDRNVALLEAGCGAGRVSLGLHGLGFRNLTAFDFAEELLAQAVNLAAERGVDDIRFLHADATNLRDCPAILDHRYDGVLFMFNGLMQIPGRDARRRALLELRAVSAPGAPLLFTTHDRNESRSERALWRLEAVRWERGEQDRRLVEFGDRYFADDNGGNTFMHLPDREEILADLDATGWQHLEDHLRRELCRESKAVKDFSDECRFWVARNQG